MAFTIYQAGSTLYGLNGRGVSVALALPAGVALDAGLPARFATFGNYVAMVNSPSRPLAIDANLNVRVLSPNAPAQPLTLSGVGGGTLSGTFQVRQTFIVLDQFGGLVAESDFGPTTAAATITANFLKVAAINLSNDAVSGTRLYRTTSGTSVFFKWIDVNGNLQTIIQDDVSDAGLATFAASKLGTPPDLALIAEFRSRLWGIGKTDPNYLFYSEIAQGYAWPSDNVFAIPRLGSDTRGATGLVRRRDALGIGRANGFYQLTGTSDADFRIVNLSENMGIEAPDSIAVYKDIAFFLWKDGVYRWDVNGIKNVSDEHVSRLFSRNNTLNLARLPNAFAHVDPHRKTYRLFLAAAGSPIENMWIEYDFTTGRWWGPHTSAAMNPSSAFIYSFDSGLQIPMIGARDGFVRVDRRLRKDDTNTGIEFDVVTANHTAGEPDVEKYWGELYVNMKPQRHSPIGTMDVQPVVGSADEVRSDNPADVFQADLTLDRERLGRCGQGKACRIRFHHSTPGEDVNIRGYEISPISIVGQR